MEYNFQMERSFGCQYISVLNTSDDHELIEAGQSLSCYVSNIYPCTQLEYVWLSVHFCPQHFG